MKGAEQSANMEKIASTPRPGIKPGPPANAGDALPLNYRDRLSSQQIIIIIIIIIIDVLVMSLVLSQILSPVSVSWLGAFVFKVFGLYFLFLPSSL